MNYRIKIPLYILATSVLIGIIYVINFPGRPPQAEVNRVIAPAVDVDGVVAGAHAEKSPVAPQNKIISPTGGQPDKSNAVTLKVHSIDKTSDASPSPTIPGPETITVNLRTPHDYTLKPGESSPILKHQMTDGKQYEWLPGYATAWQDEPRDLTLPVWSYIQLPRPLEPYVSTEIPFVIQAASNAPAGRYEVSVAIVLRPGIIAHIPVTVTVKP